MKGLWDGITTAWTTVKTWFEKLPGRIVTAAITTGSFISWLYDSGVSVMTGMYDGIKYAWPHIRDFFKALPANILQFFLDIPSLLHTAGKYTIDGFFVGIKEIWYAAQVLVTSSKT